MNAIIRSRVVARLLGLGLLGAPSALFAQAPAAPAPAPAPTPAAPAASGTPAPAPPAASSAAPPLAPPATSAPLAQLPAAPAFPMAEGEATAGQPAVPAPAPRYLVPRVIAVEHTSPPEPPRPPKANYPIGLELNFMPVWQTGRGYDLFSSNDISTRIGLAAALDLLDVADKTPLSLEVGWSTESQRGDSVGNSLSAEMSAHNLHGGLQLRHQLFSFLAPHLHAAAGATSLSLDYTAFGATANRSFESHEWLAFGFFGAGVTATIPANIVVRPGLAVEGGYLVSQSMPLRLEPTSPGQSIATSGASLGTLERSGPYLRFGFFVRY